MKIILFNGYEVWGGGEKWNFEITEQLLKSGHEVFFIGPSTGELYNRLHHLAETEQRLSVINFTISDKSYLNLLKQFVFWILLKSLNADRLIFNSYRDVRALGIPAGLSGIKRRFLRVGTPHAPKNKWSYRLTFKWGLTDLVGISEECINVFKTEVPQMISHLKISKITNGIDVNKFIPTKKEMGIPFIFGNCCRLTEQKGLKLFIQAIYELKLKGHQIKGVIAGDGEQKTELIAFAKQLNSENEIEFIGHIEKTEDFYPQIDCLLFTSYFEGTARTILEAFACEKPVIAFKASSMEEMVSDGVDGYLVKPFEVSDLVIACEKILAQKKSLPEFGIRGRDKVFKEYNNQNTYQKWVKLIVVM